MQEARSLEGSNPFEFLDHKRSASHKARMPNRVLWNNRRKKPESAQESCKLRPAEVFAEHKILNTRGLRLLLSGMCRPDLLFLTTIMQF